MAKYDPDASPDDFDPDDLEMVEGWLNDPGNTQMLETLGRDFAASPPADQVEELGRHLARCMRSRDDMAAVLAGQPPDDPRWRVHDHLVGSIRATVARIAALSEPRA